MNSRTASTIKTFLEYLGRGATPVDGSNWIEVQKAPGVGKQASPVAEKNDAYWAKVAADSALNLPRRFSYPCNNC
jgi:hypothetical protein